MASTAARIGVLGGTFDPPHHGHLAAAASAAHHLGLDRTLLVVANVPWQKVGDRDVTDAAIRLAMVQAMVAESNPELALEASPVEIERGGPSYTADTLRALHDHHPGAELWLIIGADVAGSLDTWERPDEVKRLAGLAVFDRAGTAAPFDDLRDGGWRVERVPLTRLDVRSTDVRAMVGRGEPVDGLIPPSAIRIIAERRLYAAVR